MPFRGERCRDYRPRRERKRVCILYIYIYACIITGRERTINAGGIIKEGKKWRQRHLSWSRCWDPLKGIAGQNNEDATTFDWLPFRCVASTAGCSGCSLARVGVRVYVRARAREGKSRGVKIAVARSGQARFIHRV